MGAFASSVILFVMAIIAWQTDGIIAGWLLLACLVLYSLGRGLCSVSAKDVLGKTISKTRRGRLMGYSASLAGLVTLIIGFVLIYGLVNMESMSVLLSFMIVAAALWLLALLSFATIIEPAGATEGGANAISEAIRSLRLVIDDKPFQQYVVMRVLLLSIALVIPFYTILIQQKMQG